MNTSLCFDWHLESHQSSGPSFYERPPWFCADQIFFGIERIKYIFSCVLAPENADCLDIIVINVVILISNWSLLQHHLFQHQSWKFKRIKEKETFDGSIDYFLYWKHQIISIEYFFVFWLTLGITSILWAFILRTSSLILCRSNIFWYWKN